MGKSLRGAPHEFPPYALSLHVWLNNQVLHIEYMLPVADTAHKADQSTVFKSAQQKEGTPECPPQLLLISQIACPAAGRVDFLHFRQAFRTEFPICQHMYLLRPQALCSNPHSQKDSSKHRATAHSITRERTLRYRSAPAKCCYKIVPLLFVPIPSPQKQNQRKGEELCREHAEQEPLIHTVFRAHMK